MTPKHERVDVAAVRARVDEFQHDDEPEVVEALDAVRALLDDVNMILPGGWRPSQESFCRKVSWERVGASLFGGRRSTSTKSLGKRTLRFIEGNYRHDVTKEDRDLLDSLTNTAPREPRDVEVEFFDRWQERLSRDVKLFKSWQKRLFSKEVNRAVEGADSDVRDLDLVFLHDVISHHADPVWVEEAAGSQDLPAPFDPAMARRPRRRMTETDASGVGIYLTLARPPRAVGQYQDLLYELAKGFLPDGFHGVLIRQAQFGDAKVVDLIRRAHQLAEWVITYDKVASRALFERSGIQIISDLSVPGADGRVIISAGKVDDRLKRNVRDDLIETCGITAPDAERLAGVVSLADTDHSR